MKRKLKEIKEDIEFALIMFLIWISGGFKD